MSSPTAISPLPYDIKGLFAPEVVADPFPVYDVLRPRTPAPTTDGVWVVMRYADAIAAATNHRTFSSNMQHIDNEVLRQTPIIFEDPPGHTRHRKLVQPAFTAKRMTELAPWVDGIVDELVSAIAEDVELDAVSAFCDPLPVRAIARIMGVPQERHVDFKAWSDERTYLVARRGKPDSPEEAARIEAASAANRRMLDYFLAEARARRAQPLDDVITDLVTANDGDDALSEDEIAAVCALLLTAGNVTTTNLLGNLLAALAHAPATYDRLRADRGLVPAAIEESLRLDAPVQWMYRRALREAELGEATIPAGASLVLYYGAANRDPAVFTDPDRFDIDREALRHTAFGHGIHFCLGAPLARLEAESALNAVLDRFSSLEPGGQAAERISRAATHRGFVRLPLVFRD